MACLRSVHPAFTFKQTLLLIRLFYTGVNFLKCIQDSHGLPAPLLDALAGFVYLTQTLHYEPRSIKFMGDSAGGQLSLFLSRYLSVLSPPLPQPGYIALSSPWYDWTSSFPSRQTNNDYDYLASNIGTNAITIATRFFKLEARREPYFSPALAASASGGILPRRG